MSPFEITIDCVEFHDAILCFADKGILTRRDLVDESGIVIRVETLTQAKMVSEMLVEYEVHVDQYPKLAEAVGLYEVSVEDDEDDADTDFSEDNDHDSRKAGMDVDGIDGDKGRELYPESYRVMDLMDDGEVECEGIYKQLLGVLEVYESGDHDLPKGITTIRQYSTVVADLMMMIHAQE